MPEGNQSGPERQARAPVTDDEKLESGASGKFSYDKLSTEAKVGADAVLSSLDSALRNLFAENRMAGNRERFKRLIELADQYGHLSPDQQDAALRNARVALAGYFKSESGVSGPGGISGESRTNTDFIQKSPEGKTPQGFAGEGVSE